MAKYTENDRIFDENGREIVLKTEHLSISFGGLKAVNDVNLEIKKGELYGLIGPNGAGKTTVFNLLTGRGVSCRKGKEGHMLGRGPSGRTCSRSDSHGMEKE